VAPATEVAGVDLVVDEEGVVWVSWVGTDDAVYVARRRDGLFADPVKVTDSTRVPTVGTARRPHLAVDGERVAVVFTEGVTPEARVWLYVAEREALRFEETLLGETGVNDTLDQPTVALDQGEVWVAWKYGKNHDYGIAIARESEDYGPVPITGFPGQPCECCPHELTLMDGQPVLVQRGNESDLREIYLGFVDDQGVADVHRVSWNDWIVPGCPYDGPVTARTASGRVLASWVDATGGEARAWVSRSEDDGRSWDVADVVLPESERSQAWPQLATDGEQVWLTIEEIWRRTRLFTSPDGGTTWTELPVEEDVVDAQLASGGGTIGMIGLNAEDHLIWSDLGSTR